MERKLTPRMTVGLSTLIATVIALGITVTISELWLTPPSRGIPEEVVILVQVKVFITSFNMFLLTVLAGSYISLYVDLPNKYTRSLLLISGALLLYAVTSHPVVQVLFGFPPRPNLGPFGFLPDLFVGVAIVILLYQSQT
ncbi:hypothetical protein [Halorubrum amylolyticum]|uniref:hypothetical protein n=1 Tax=Halorubrum amylolyticum TaxID=2508724 RepID=UPI001F511BBB|nr:hypothetical protein [Halorubrum amylolyticum]